MVCGRLSLRWKSSDPSSIILLHKILINLSKNKQKMLPAAKNAPPIFYFCNLKEQTNILSFL